MSKEHHKLVRDKIPDLIRANGEKPVIRVLGDREYFQELVRKLDEEVTEFKEAYALEELADVQEVLLALAEAIASQEELETVRKRKEVQRGAFRDKYYLERTE